MSGFFKHPKWGTFNREESDGYFEASSVPPNFVERIKTTEVKEGEPVRFFVRVAGRPQPVIRWFRNGKEIINSPDFEILHEGDVYTLSIPEVFNEDSGKYTVKAENNAGNAECTAELIVDTISDFSSPSISRSSSVVFSSDRGGNSIFSGSSRENTPQRSGRQFTQPLTNKSASEGSEVVLSCTLPAFPHPDKIEWFCNDVKIQPSTDYTVSFRQGICSLTIAEAFPEDSGQYSCVATYRGEPPVSTSMELQIRGASAGLRNLTKCAPVFEKTMTNLLLCPGYDAFFECKVTGNPPPEIIWTRRGHPLWDKNRYYSTYDQETGISTLKIINTNSEDEGEYVCRAVNSIGESSTSSALLSSEHFQQWKSNILELKGPPAAPPPPPPPGGLFLHSSRTVDQEGEWNQGGEFKVSKFEKNLMREIDYREKKFSGRDFEPEEPEDNGSALEQSRSVPCFIQKPQRTSLREGFDAILTCSISGSPLPNIQWYHNGRLIRPSARYEMQLTREGACSLRIHSPLRQDAGHYTCCATNIIGRDTCSAELYIEGEGPIDETSYVSAEALRKIVGQPQLPKSDVDEEPGGVSELYSAPVFLSVPSDLAVNEGETVRLDCRPAGRPLPDIRWFLDGRQVFDDRSHKLVVNQDGIHSLIFDPVSAKDNGMYTCIAKNKGGETKFSLMFSVMPRPVSSIPRFSVRLMNQTVQEGMPVTFMVDVSGFPVPSLNWQKDGQTIKNDPRYDIRSDGG